MSDPLKRVAIVGSGNWYALKLFYHHSSLKSLGVQQSLK